MYVQVCGHAGDTTWKRRFCVLPVHHVSDHRFADRAVEYPAEGRMVVEALGDVRELQRDVNGNYHYLKEN